MQFEEWLSHVPNKKHWREAYEEALRSPGVGRGGFRHGAVLTYGPVLLKTGFNSYKTHRRLACVTEYPFLHAEQHAIFKHGIDNCQYCELYVIRVKRTGDIGSSKPCDICMHFIKEARVYEVSYSTEVGVDLWTSQTRW